MTRPSWDEYFMSICEVISTRATCDRLHVGCVIVKDNRIISTGYNGALAKTPSCDDEGHIIRDNHCVRVNHAELNAILYAARHGISLDGSTVYVTNYTCWDCFRAVASVGVKRIVYKDGYKNDPLVEEHAKLLGIEVIQYKKEQ